MTLPAGFFADSLGAHLRSRLPAGAVHGAENAAEENTDRLPTVTGPTA